METKRPTNTDNLRVIAARTAEQLPSRKRLTIIVTSMSRRGIVGVADLERVLSSTDWREVLQQGATATRNVTDVHGAVIGAVNIHLRGGE